MPFDGTHFDSEIDLTKLQPGKEGLRQLSYLLRHPEMLPNTHIWNFNYVYHKTDCGTSGCALGTAIIFWNVPKQWEWDILYHFQDLMGTHNYTGIFSACPLYVKKTYGVAPSQVTSTMVADAIDHYLTTGSVPVAGEAADAV